MKNKKGFTLIELVVSIVLVSVILVSLLGSLIQIRNVYTVIHENSDVIVYSSSISRVINSDINDNNGIRYVSCETDGRKCSIILGNDSRRELILTDNEVEVDDTTVNILHTNNKSTLKYYDTTKFDKTNNEEDKELLYIRTLELDKYVNSDSQVTTSSGYNFTDMSATQYEYTPEEENNSLDMFTTINIKILDGVSMDISKYDITLYGAGRYDYSGYYGKAYSIDLDNDGADTAGTTAIDEVFGVGFFKAESAHKKIDQIESIEVPTKEGKAFLGYYYTPYGVSVETKVIDSGGNIVAHARTFRNDVVLGDELTGEVKAKWGDCAEGFKLENGKCIQEEYTVTLNRGLSGKTCNTGVGTTEYQILFNNKVPDVVIPQCAGYTFEGYLDSGNKKYHNRTGVGLEYYDKTENTTFNAKWNACDVGQYSLITSQSCTDCARGSYSNATGSAKCEVCKNGKTTNGTKQTSCNKDCANNANVLSWKTPTWNGNTNTVTNECTIATCKTGYHLSSNACVANTYTIEYALNSGSHGTSHPTTGTYDTTFTVNNPSRSEYTFAGWKITGMDSVSHTYGSSTTTSSSISATKETSFKNLRSTNGTVTFTAQWCQNCASVSNGSCSLTTALGTTCTYSTSCNSGYHISSGDGTRAPVCEKDAPSIQCVDSPVYCCRVGSTNCSRCGWADSSNACESGWYCDVSRYHDQICY